MWALAPERPTEFEKNAGTRPPAIRRSPQAGPVPEHGEAIHQGAADAPGQVSEHVPDLTSPAHQVTRAGQAAEGLVLFDLIDSFDIVGLPVN